MANPLISVLGIILACTLSLCGKLFNQKPTLYTISAISVGGYALNGNVVAMALTHSFTVLMYRSILGMCSFLDVTFKAIPISESGFLIHLKALSASILHIQKPCDLYAQATCWIDVIMVFFVLLHINSTVPKCIFLEVIIGNGILFIAIISIASVTSPYCCIIS